MSQKHHKFSLVPMASPARNPSYSSGEDPDYEAAADSEEEDTEEEEEEDEESPAEVEVIVIPSSGGRRIETGDREQEDESEYDDDEEQWGRNDTKKVRDGRDNSAAVVGNPNGVESDGSFVPNCPVCFLPWTSDGPHRVCCVPCGHIYGRSCLEKWIQRCHTNLVKCPLCNRKFKKKEIINLYAPLIAVQNDELEKELCILRKKNELLELEKAHLLEETRKHKKLQMNREHSERLRVEGFDHASSGATRRRLLGHSDERWSSCSQNSLENSLPIHNYNGGGYRNCILDLQIELMVDDARVLGIEAFSQILLFSGKRPGVLGEHILSKISLLAPREIHKVALPPNTGVIRDLCMLPSGLALLASLGKKLSLFSMGSNNLVLKYDLPDPAWSCSGDFSSPNHIYAGLQNGMLLVFDIRQTATHMDSMEGLSRHPIHTIHSIPHGDNCSKVVTASSSGPCVWDVGGNRERPFLIPDMEDQGICLALACSSSSDDMVASFRPKVETSNSAASFRPSTSSSAQILRAGKLGSHVLIKRLNRATFQKHEVTTGSVSEARMSKSAIVCSEGNSPLFAYGDESACGVCLRELPSFHVCNYLKPHQHPILDLKCARSTGPGILGCISEDRLQVFTYQ